MTTATAPSRIRLDSIDLLRGAVMIIMALDHTRDFFSNQTFNPTDLATTTPALFFTRWITHFCAPVFVFLAGTGAFLYGRKSPEDLPKFLLTRGIWMIVLELTLVRFGWVFNLDYSQSVAQVIWAIGWSMIALAAVVRLPLKVIAALGIGIIFLHNTLNPVIPEQLGTLNWVWTLLHEGGSVGAQNSANIWVIYPLIPWPGVMMAGFALGTVFTWETDRRKRFLLRAGVAAILVFIILRLSNFYGDPFPWIEQKDAVFTFLSFMNCEKYPPSLCYLLMTLGPALLMLGLADGVRASTSKIANAIILYGRVPLLYYIAHLYLIHLTAIIIASLQGFPVGWLFSNAWFMERPPTFGFGLGGVYAIWLGIVIALYPLCRWYAEFKRRSSSPVWKYF